MNGLQHRRRSDRQVQVLAAVTRTAVEHPTCGGFAFNRRSTPIIHGRISKISVDAFVDDRTQALYYFAEISVPEIEIPRLGANVLVSGMPIEAFITTESRSPISYVMKPLSDYFSRAFRDS